MISRCCLVSGRFELFHISLVDADWFLFVDITHGFEQVSLRPSRCRTLFITLVLESVALVSCLKLHPSILLGTSEKGGSKQREFVREGFLWV